MTTVERAAHEALRARAVAAVREHAPELAGAPVEELGSGLDHAAFLVGDLVVRASADGAGSREAELLVLVGRSVPVPVPVPRFADAARGVLAYPRLPGRPLLGRDAPPGTAALLGRFLRRLHDVDPGAVAGLVPTEPADPAEWLEDLTGPAALLDVLRAGPPPPGRDLVLAHADLGAEHLLADGGRLTGVIDWSDAAVTDPALDLARPYRDFGPAFLEGVLEVYGPVTPEVRERVVFFARCAALEDLAFGEETGRHEYARAARRSLSWLFPASARPER